ncbi:hypothetical protein D3C74_294950 [compost metagenome]
MVPGGRATPPFASLVPRLLKAGACPAGLSRAGRSRVSSRPHPRDRTSAGAGRGASVPAQTVSAGSRRWICQRDGRRRQRCRGAPLRCGQNCGWSCGNGKVSMRDVNSDFQCDFGAPMDCRVKFENNAACRGDRGVFGREETGQAGYRIYVSNIDAPLAERGRLQAYVFV